MAKYQAREVARVYEVERQPNPWGGWLVFGLVVILMLASCN